MLVWPASTRGDDDDDGVSRCAVCGRVWDTPKNGTYTLTHCRPFSHSVHYYSILVLPFKVRIYISCCGGMRASICDREWYVILCLHVAFLLGLWLSPIWMRRLMNAENNMCLHLRVCRVRVYVYLAELTFEIGFRLFQIGILLHIYHHTKCFSSFFFFIVMFNKFFRCYLSMAEC